MQTVYPFLVRKHAVLQAERIKLHSTDDFVVVDVYNIHQPRTVIVSHGFESNSQGKSILGMAAYLLKHNFNVMAWNFRSCAPEGNNHIRCYHGGFTDDFPALVTYAADVLKSKEIYLLGFSLGGNITLKWLGENNSELTNKITKAVAISVPCDLEASSLKLERKMNSFYKERFLKTLRHKAILRIPHFESTVSIEQVKSFKSLYEFDDKVFAPLYGFKDAKDYHEKNSSKKFLHAIKIPTLILSAKNDPFLTEECFPVEECRANKNVFLELPEHGGHVGFCMDRANGNYYSEKRAVKFFAS